tara:strand:- start:4052 stop:4402 length:351 start_codon:yes stop_codon:yes gene_type:complete
MGGRTGEFIRDQSRKIFERKRATYNQELAQYKDRLKFRKTSTREGGLSDSEIGKAPTMTYSKGIMGGFEHSQHMQSLGVSGADYLRERQIFRKSQRGFGKPYTPPVSFSGSAQGLG